MSLPTLKNACRFYAAVVTGCAVLAIGAATCSFLPSIQLRGYELVLARAESIAMAGALLSVLMGGTLFVCCLWSNVEPPRLLIQMIVMSILLLACNVLFLPAIATA